MHQRFSLRNVEQSILFPKKPPDCCKCLRYIYISVYLKNNTQQIRHIIYINLRIILLQYYHRDAAVLLHRVHPEIKKGEIGRGRERTKQSEPTPISISLHSNDSSILRALCWHNYVTPLRIRNTLVIRPAILPAAHLHLHIGRCK